MHLPDILRYRLESGYDVISFTPFSSEAAWICLLPEQTILNTISVRLNETNPQTIPSQASSMSTSPAPTTPPGHGFLTNQTVDPTLVLIYLMQQSLQQNATMIAQLNSCPYPHPPQPQSLSYQFKPQRPPLSKMGRYTTNDHPVPSTDRYLQGRSLLRRGSLLDANNTN